MRDAINSSSKQSHMPVRQPSRLNDQASALSTACSRKVPCLLFAAMPRHHPITYALLALELARLFRTSNRACFLNTITLKRSKSLNCFLRAALAVDFAAGLLAHLLSTSNFAHAFSRPVWPMASGSFGSTMLVRERWESGADWRGTTLVESVEGPSTRTCSLMLESRAFGRC